MKQNIASRIDMVRGALEPALIVEDPEARARYSRDWSGDYVGSPALVVRPRTTEEVAQVVRLCAASQVSIVPQGGHTGLVGGATPSPASEEVIVSLERMNRIRQIDPLNFSMIAEAGCVLQSVQEAALEEDRYFPLALGAQGSCQIGGNIATNAGGLNVLRYGMMRDLVLGVEAVLADGQIWNGLRNLRKNNTGYDLKQLFLGSEGTLGVVTAAALKLFPRPTQVVTAFLAVESISAAMEIYGLARRDLSDLLSAFELIPRNGVELAMQVMPDLRDPLRAPSPAYVLLEAAASGLANLPAMMEKFLESLVADGLVVDGAVAANKAQTAAFWRIREGMIEAQVRHGRHLRTDVSVPISSIPRFIAETDALLAERAPQAILLRYGHVGDGNIHYNVLPPSRLLPSEVAGYLHRCEETIFEVVDRFGGSISAEHGIGITKRAAFLERISPLHLDLLRGVKSAFDPGRLLSPGRVVPS
ncbi:MAG TPA: FAD-binding oxidoreductase [Roseiarcus sp.]|jgi:FAD/FMN-containing dehydrogenase